jgi:hypothetical protein
VHLSEDVKLLNPQTHRFFGDKLPTVGLFDPLADARAKAVFVRNQAKRRILHRSLGVDAFLSR